MTTTEEPKVLIWSNQHQGWWGRRWGYTSDRKEAGRFSMSEATDICRKANFVLRSDGVPSEAIVPIDERWRD